MRILLLAWLTLATQFIMAQSPELTEARELYQKASSGKTAAKSLNSKLSVRNYSDQPVMKGYQGASFAIMAEYGFNPFEKLKLFKTGTAILEEAIHAENENWELRYIRFTVQDGSPSFLGYRHKLREDKSYLMKALPDALEKPDEAFIARKAVEYLLASGEVTDTEKDELRRLPVFN